MTRLRRFGRALRLLALGCALEGVGHARPSSQDPGVVELSFGRVLWNAPVAQTIGFENATDRSLHIENVQLTPPLLVEKIISTLAPHAVGELKLKLAQPREPGPFSGIVLVNFTDKSVAPVAFRIEGYVVPPVEFKPGAAFFVATHRGVPKQASIEIINHREQPLKLTHALHQSERFEVELEPLSEGQRYRLTLTLTGKGPAGELSEPIRLVTEGEDPDCLTIQANTLLKERVYTFPEAVDMGALPLDVLREEAAGARLAQTLMVYRPGTTDFRIRARTDLDTLRIEAELGPGGDRYQLTVAWASEKIRPGTYRGTIYIETNDSEFPLMSVPVTGAVLERD